MELSRIRLPFAFKMALSAALLALAALALFGYLSFRQHSGHLVEIISEELRATVRNSAPLFSSIPLDPDLPGTARRGAEELERLAKRNPKPSSFRLLAFKDGTPTLVAWTGKEGVSTYGAGDPYAGEPHVTNVLASCARTAHTCVTPLYEDEAGRWITAVAPIIDGEGRLVGMLAADREAAEYEHALAGAVRRMLIYSVAALAAAVLLGVFLSARVARPIKRLYEASRAAREGRFEPIEPAGSDEVASLTRDFNETHQTLLQKMAELETLAGELEHRVRERTEELRKSYDQLRSKQDFLQREMNIARRVQETIIPRRLETERVAVEVEYLPVSGLGGDWGIVAPGKDGALNVAVGDVTGHGTGAALVVNRVYTLVNQLWAREAGLESLLYQLDYFLAEELADIGIYMTFMVCRFDLEAMKVQFAGAGHPPVIVYRPGGDLAHLDSHCGILGVGELFCEVPAVREFELESGDVVVFHTDGLTEAINAENEQFGRQRLEKTIVKALTEGCDGKKMLSCITDDVKKFTGGYLQDDVLLVAAQVR